MRQYLSLIHILQWDEAMNLIRKLFKDGNYNMSLLISLGCFFGLRISDILSLRWNQILNVSAVSYTHLDVYKRQAIDEVTRQTIIDARCEDKRQYIQDFVTKQIGMHRNAA